jgi:hypothetical protein
MNSATRVIVNGISCLPVPLNLKAIKEQKAINKQ